MRWVRIALSYALGKWNPHPTVILPKGLGGDASPPLPVLSLNLVSYTDKDGLASWRSSGNACTGIRTDLLPRIVQTGYEEWKKAVSFPHKPKRVPLCCASWPLTSKPCSPPFQPDGLYLLPQSADTYFCEISKEHLIFHSTGWTFMKDTTDKTCFFSGTAWSVLGFCFYTMSTFRLVDWKQQVFSCEFFLHFGSTRIFQTLQFCINLKKTHYLTKYLLMCIHFTNRNLNIW